MKHLSKCSAFFLKKKKKVFSVISLVCYQLFVVRPSMNGKIHLEFDRWDRTDFIFIIWICYLSLSFPSPWTLPGPLIYSKQFEILHDLCVYIFASKVNATGCGWGAFFFSPIGVKSSRNSWSRISLMCPFPTFIFFCDLCGKTWLFPNFLLVFTLLPTPLSFPVPS